MDLPIDARKAPFRSKYLTEETRVLNHWFIFGTSGEGLVDIADGDGDVIIAVPIDQATALIKARDHFCAEVERVLGK